MFCTECGKELVKGSNFCSSCGKSSSKKEVETIEKSDKGFLKLEKTVEGEHINFYNVPLSQLIILSFLTLGLYEIYWHIRNWTAVQKARKISISPFWRGVFGPIFSFELFKYILSNANSVGYAKSVNPTSAVAAISYFILCGTVAVVGRYTPAPEDAYIYLFWWAVLMLLSIMPLVPFQKAIEFSNQKSGVLTPQEFETKEKVLVGIGIILFIFSILGSLPAVSNINNEPSFSVTQKSLASWVSFNSQEDDFSVELPSFPEREFESVPLGDGTFAYSVLYTSSANENEGFIIATYTYSMLIDDSDIESNLYSVAQGITDSTPSGIMSDYEMGYFDGHRAIDFSYSFSDGFVKAKVIYVGQKYHYIAYYYEGLENYDLSNHNKFLSTFQIQ